MEPLDPPPPRRCRHCPPHPPEVQAEKVRGQENSQVAPRGAL